MLNVASQEKLGFFTLCCSQEESLHVFENLGSALCWLLDRAAVETSMLNHLGPSRVSIQSQIQAELLA